MINACNKLFCDYTGEKYYVNFRVVLWRNCLSVGQQFDLLCVDSFLFMRLKVFSSTDAHVFSEQGNGQ